MAEVTISIAALVVSFFSLIFTILYSRKRLRTNIAPILIFSRDQLKGWLLENVGNGPALNVVVYDGDLEALKKAVRCYGIAKGAIIDLPWTEHPEQLGATYEDAMGNQYTSLAKDDLTTIKRGTLIKWQQEIQRERYIRHKLAKHQK